MKDVQASRRGFFKTVAIGGATAAAAVATVVVGDRKSAINSAGADTPKQTGYRETEHIRQYYRTTQV
jgi:NaMN:DMB phosphoribosyltransferase